MLEQYVKLFSFEIIFFVPKINYLSIATPNNMRTSKHYIANSDYLIPHTQFKDTHLYYLWLAVVCSKYHAWMVVVSYLNVIIYIRLALSNWLF